MTGLIWAFALVSLIIAILVFLFIRFCRSNVLSKAISTVLVLFAAVGGSKVTPAYTGKIGFMTSAFSLDGQFSVGGTSTDTSILIVVLGVLFVFLVGCYTYLRANDKV
jgi:hypothetical protein